MKILYHITGYKSPEQFSWLFNAIYDPDDIFVIHIDRKAPLDIHRMYKKIVDCRDNVVFSPSIDIVWGGTGLIRAEMMAIELALQIDDGWQYIINLTAQDYPVVPVRSIRAQLENSWPYNYVGCSPVGDEHWRIRKRRWFHHFDGRNRRLWSPLPFFPPSDVKLKWYGPWWHILTRDFCKWWLSSAKAKKYLQVHERIGMPDEMLIQNLIQDSPFEEYLRPECKHAIIWRYSGEPRSTSARPNVLTIHDLPKITSTRAFFARKFDQTVDKEILSALAKRVSPLAPSSAYELSTISNAPS